MFDTDKDGEIDIRECMLALWNYCSLAEQDLASFAFDLYDMDESGLLSKGEVAKMMRDLQGTVYNRIQYSKR